MKVLCDSEGIKKTVQIVKNGGVIVFPTDTVYGIGCDPYNKEAVSKIFKIKNRSLIKSLPVLGYSIKELSRIVKFDPITMKIVKKFWPGQITVIAEITDFRIKDSLNLQNTVAVRVPNHKCTLNILEKLKLLVGTSANVSGTKSFTDSSECIKNISGYDLFVDGGKIQSNGESTIIQVKNEKLEIIREGAISVKRIQEVL